VNNVNAGNYVVMWVWWIMKWVKTSI